MLNLQILIIWHIISQFHTVYFLGQLIATGSDDTSIKVSHFLQTHVIL